MADTIDLAGTWRLRPDHDDRGIRERWWAARWGEGVDAHVPAAWQLALGEDAPEVVWYRRRARVPESWRRASRRVWLRFDGVSTDCRAWVNGREVGRHVGDYVPFRFDLTQAASGGAELEITLRVDRVRPVKPGPGWLQGGHVTKGFHDVLSLAHGGVWQGVRLEATGPASIMPDGVRVIADRASGKVRVLVETEGDAGARAAIELLSPDGACMDRTEAAANENTVLHCDSPLAWSPDRPTLYAVRVTLTCDGERSHEASVRFGFRTVETGGPGNSRILLNGRAVFLSGVLDWGHEPSHGAPAPTPCELRARFARLREMGFNCVCLCMWYAPRWLYDIADEVGMLLWQEHPIWQSAMGDEHLDEYRRLCGAFLRRDRNHPSVIIVSATCEHPAFNPALAAWWWERARRELPHSLLEVQTASFAWADRDHTDLHDEHTYEDAPRWVTYLQDLQEELRAHARAGRARPFVMGESVLYTSWPDVRRLRDRVGASRPWWLPKGFDACAAFDARLREEHGDDVADRFSGDGHRFHLLGRRFQLERFREYPNHAGLVQNHLRDVPACRCGFIDDLDQWRFKPEQMRSWLAPACLILRTPGHRRAASGGRRLECELLVSNFSPTDIREAIEVRGHASEPARIDIHCPAGDVSGARFDLEIPDTDVPVSVEVDCTSEIESNPWRLWALPPASLTARVLSAVRWLECPPIDSEPIKLDIEKGYSKGFGLHARSAPFNPPNAAEVCAPLGIQRLDRPTSNGVRTVVTHRMTPEVADFVLAGGQALVLASNGAGGIGSVAEWHFGSVPLVLEHGPLSVGDSAWVVDLLVLDLVERWCRSVPSEAIGIADQVEPIIRQVYTHDQGKPLMLDLLCAARAGAGLIVISSLDHTGVAGRYALARVLEFLDQGTDCRGELDPAIVRSWAAS